MSDQGQYHSRYAYDEPSLDTVVQGEEDQDPNGFFHDGTRQYIPPPQTEPTGGYLYILKSEYGDFKIGISVHPRQRFTRLRKQYKFQWEPVLMFFDLHYLRLEFKLHQEFKSKRTRIGDWFALTPADIEYIKGLAQ